MPDKSIMSDAVKCPACGKRIFEGDFDAYKNTAECAECGKKYQLTDIAETLPVSDNPTRPKNIKVIKNNGITEIYLKMSWIPVLGVAPFAVVFTYALIFKVNEYFSVATLIFSIPFSLIVLLLYFIILLHLFSKIKITIAGKKVTFLYSFFFYHSKSEYTPVCGVSIRKVNNSRGAPEYLICLNVDGKNLPFGEKLSYKEKQFIAAEIQKNIQ